MLRQRGAAKNLANWVGSSLDSALQVAVGRICSPLLAPDESWFQNLVLGQGALPSTTPNSILTLGTSLNKLKNRTTSVLNFALPAAGGHMLYVLTQAGMRQPATLCEIDIDLFCRCCGSTANHV